MSCNLETNPSIDHITTTKVCSSLLPPNLLPPTYRNLAVHLRSTSSSTSSSSSNARPSFLSSLRLFLSINTPSCDRLVRSSYNRLRIYWVVMGHRGRSFDLFRLLYCRKNLDSLVRLAWKYTWFCSERSEFCFSSVFITLPVLYAIHVGDALFL